MNYFDAWTLLAIAFTFNVAYFSYKAGHKEGVRTGIESALDQLEAQGVIELEDSPEE
jgi:hypothetical protein